MQNDRRSLNDAPLTDAGRGSDGGLDRGFGRMLQQAGISAELEAELGANRDPAALTLLEEAMLRRWPVDDYQRLLQAPSDLVNACEADYGRFLEAAAAVATTLESYDVSELMQLRVTVSGIQLDWDRIELSDLFFGQIWLAETRMLEWLADHAGRVESLCRLGRPFALAKSALDLQHRTGLNRCEAIESGRAYPYLLALFERAFNLYGLNVVPESLLPAAGLNPLPLALCSAGRSRANLGASKLFRSFGIRPRRASAIQLRCIAQILFENRQIEPEQYSLLAHGHWLLPTTEGALQQDWIDILGTTLAELWIQGDRGAWVETTLDLLKRAESGVAA